MSRPRDNRQLYIPIYACDPSLLFTRYELSALHSNVSLSSFSSTAREIARFAWKVEMNGLSGEKVVSLFSKHS